MEVELIPFEFGEEVEGEIEGVADEGGGLVGGEVLEGGHGLVAVEVVEMEEIGHELTFDLDEGGVEAEVVLGGIHIEEHHHLPFHAPGLGDASQIKAIVNLHNRTF